MHVIGTGCGTCETKRSRFTFGLMLSFAAAAVALVYALALLDPYIALLMAPFFALGCGRGKHPLVLLALSAVPALVLVVASAAKFAVTGMPLIVHDQYFVRSNLLLLAYNDWRVAAALIIAVAGLVAYLWGLLAGRGRFSRFEQLGVAALGLAAVTCIVGVQRWDRDIFDLDDELNAPTIRAFLKSGLVPKPRLHVVAQAQAAADPRLSPANQGLAAPNGERPDIFFVLEESTMRPDVVGANHEPHTLFARVGADNPSAYTGPLHVHTFAGGTWKSEFSILTQMRPQEFGNDGLYVFHQLEGRIRRSVFTELKALGYRAIGVYPVPGNFINGRAFYESIGVDEFYDPESLGIGKGWDWKIPDAKLFRAMLDKIDERPGPVVVMMLTINQHGPHNVQNPIDDYVARYKASDDAYAEFLHMLAARGKKAGVAAFGDHQPEFTARFLDDHATWYFTDYDVRCVNFACADGPLAKRGAKPLDVIMLPAAALEAFGFTLDSFSARQRELFGDCDDNVTLCDTSRRLEFNSAFARYYD